ncbi:MAG: DUF2269 family protein [Chloroflexota bacterium]|nr:DUF2269 family protein [Chloroflexota bacterium]
MSSIPLFPLLLAVHVALAVALFLPSLILPFLLRTRRQRGGEASWPVRTLLAMQGTGAVVIGAGLAVTGIGLLLVLGPSLIGRPWLIAALVLYAVNLLVAAFISRPTLRRLARLPAGRDEEWRRQARRQRWIAYGMAGATGIIGLLMTAKPRLW